MASKKNEVNLFLPIKIKKNIPKMHKLILFTSSYSPYHRVENRADSLEGASFDVIVYQLKNVGSPEKK
ncbi:MAG: hypothetical protein MK198_09265 [Gracilimonas sp.]|uniref:hypothetical protein n=1 Tax=Gracilimonas sp. TaxID=1974203 RepID=UPI003752847A|nr:hypothetical protein [Gracilimonas sp.]